MELKAWRRGYNLLRGKNTTVYEKLGTSEPKLKQEAFEEDFLADIEHANGTGKFQDIFLLGKGVSDYGGIIRVL